MQQQEIEIKTPIEQLQSLTEVFSNRSLWPAALQAARTHARAVADFGNQNGLTDIESLLRIVDELVDALLMIHTDEAAQTNVNEIAQFCQTASDSILGELDGQMLDVDTLPNLISNAHEKWGDFLFCRDSLEEFDAWRCDSPIQEDPPIEDISDVSAPACDTQQIGLILGTLGGIGDMINDGVATLSDPAPTQAVETPAVATRPAASPFGETTSDEPIVAPPPVTIDLDQETVNAFADDAVQCVSVIETEVLRYEQDPNSLDALRQICRELHTIKGAVRSDWINSAGWISSSSRRLIGTELSGCNANRRGSRSSKCRCRTIATGSACHCHGQSRSTSRKWEFGIKSRRVGCFGDAGFDSR